MAEIFEDPATLGDHAGGYGRTGLEVFPLYGDKTPRTRNGMHDASADLDQIARW